METTEWTTELVTSRLTLRRALYVYDTDGPEAARTLLLAELPPTLRNLLLNDSAPLLLWIAAHLAVAADLAVSILVNTE